MKNYRTDWLERAQGDLVISEVLLFSEPNGSCELHCLNSHFLVNQWFSNFFWSHPPLNLLKNLADWRTIQCSVQFALTVALLNIVKQVVYSLGMFTRVQPRFRWNYPELFVPGTFYPPDPLLSAFLSLSKVPWRLVQRRRNVPNFLAPDGFHPPHTSLIKPESHRRSIGCIF